MNTMNPVYFFRIKRQQFTISKTLTIIRKILIVASVYLVFGLLFKYVYASIDTGNNPYQAQQLLDYSWRESLTVIKQPAGGKVDRSARQYRTNNSRQRQRQQSCLRTETHPGEFPAK